MTPQETAMLEAARSACLAAINATQSAYQVIEAVLGAADHTEPETPDWGTFDTEDAPTAPPTTGATNGRQGKR